MCDHQGYLLGATRRDWTKIYTPHRERQNEGDDLTETLEATRSLLGAVVKPLAGVSERLRGDAGEPWGDVCGVGVTTRDIAHA